ncbi:hypothetical protein [Actinocrispum wychmicini]|uniref:Lipoprotein n=1 Tax=Actinocrispum wychmicini TaxID=1213861 RepID=A0A4R2K0E2_9PSEU|nr:hypothetical protein [Actinocrispum wychmicini]TCO65072.1 hypothetical protein EV192_101856 [Actinocrispum wychmicini]
MRGLVGALPLALLLVGCSIAVRGTPVQPSDPDLVAGYFKALDEAGATGPDAQVEFLRRTQHPDFKNLLCDLGGLTIDADPALRTLRPDQAWAPQSGTHPRGNVYVVAVSLTVLKNGQTLGQQIGSERVVVLDGSVYGFMPCPR